MELTIVYISFDFCENWDNSRDAHKGRKYDEFIFIWPEASKVLKT